MENFKSIVLVFIIVGGLLLGFMMHINANRYELTSLPTGEVYKLNKKSGELTAVLHPSVDIPSNVVNLPPTPLSNNTSQTALVSNPNNQTEPIAIDSANLTETTLVQETNLLASIKEATNMLSLVKSIPNEPNSMLNTSLVLKVTSTESILPPPTELIEARDKYLEKVSEITKPINKSYIKHLQHLLAKFSALENVIGVQYVEKEITRIRQLAIQDKVPELSDDNQLESEEEQKEITACCSGLRDGHPSQIFDGIIGELKNGIWDGSPGWVKVDLGKKRKVRGIRIYPNWEGGLAICTPSYFAVYTADTDTVFRANAIDPSLGSLHEKDPGGEYKFVEEFHDTEKGSAKDGTNFYFDNPVDARFLKFIFYEELHHNLGLRYRMTLSEIEFIYN
jgi:hypothetical protein